VLTPNVPLGDAEAPEGRYRSPAVLPNGNLLISWANGPVNEISELVATPPDYGVYVFDVQRNRRELVVNDDTVWELYAKPVTVREEPPDIASRQAVVDSATPAILGSIDIKNTSLSSKHGEKVSGAQFDSVTMDQALAEAVKVRIIEGFSSEAANQTMFGLTMAEGAAMLGEAQVYGDGSWLAQVPRTSRCICSRSTSSTSRSAARPLGSKACPAKVACAAAATKTARPRTRLVVKC